MPRSFSDTVRASGVDLAPRSIGILQVNLTRLCNQTCVHCHVDASPKRRERMAPELIAKLLAVLAGHAEIHTLDLTGGAPELHPDFKDLVRRARSLDKRVIVRHNLTVTMDPHPLTKASMADLPEFFAAQQVEVVSSLPYYEEYFTDKQRGGGVFKKSIASLALLNAQGYGADGTGLVLNLVYNPVGPFLPPAQAALERDYKRALWERFGIRFNGLFAVTNMPINRFKAQLRVLGSYDEYMDRLLKAFNPAAAASVMCRDMVSVGYDGALYDCDFNQMLGMPAGGVASLADFDLVALKRRAIKLGDHCYACTAGAGSSCGGTTV